MNIACKISFWILLLLGGAWIVSEATYHTGLPGSGAGVGHFSYRFFYTLEPNSDATLDDKLSGYVKIQGRAPSRFMVNGGKSPVYHEVTMEWALSTHIQDGGTGGTCTIDLSEMQIVAGSERLPLEQSSLRSLFGLEITSKQSDQFLDDLQSTLEGAALGTIPPPQHHVYSFEDSATQGILQHQAIGRAVRFPVLIWTGIWILLILATVIIKKPHPKDPSQNCFPT